MTSKVTDGRDNIEQHLIKTSHGGNDQRQALKYTDNKA